MKTNINIRKMVHEEMDKLLNKQKFKEGEEVILLADEDEGWEEERGYILDYAGRGMYTVEVEPIDEYDDGIREVSADDMRKI